MLYQRLPILRPRPQHIVLLFSLLSHPLSAQDSEDPSVSPTDTDADPIYISNDDTSTYLPPSSAPTTYASTPGEGDDDHTDGLLNYYFLLIAIFLVAIGILYCAVSRKRKANLARHNSSRQDALARDLSGWRQRWRRGGGRGGGNWVGLGSGWREEEGLDDRGEAPPPYVKEPERAMVREEGAFEMGRWAGMAREEAKPPGYVERGHG